MSPKDNFLNALGIKIPSHIKDFDLSFKHKYQKLPFCSIITDKNGKTFFRANPNKSSGIIIEID